MVGCCVGVLLFTSFAQLDWPESDGVAQLDAGAPHGGDQVVL